MMGERLAFQKKNGQKIAGKAYFAGVDKKYPTVILPTDSVPITVT